jgi:hypothetical protein
MRKILLDMSPENNTMNSMDMNIEVYGESLEPSCAPLERLQQESELIEKRMVLRKARKNAMTEVGMLEQEIEDQSKAPSNGRKGKPANME